jgi:hypothetical protein
MVRFRREIIFVVGFWWLWDILSTSLTNLVCPKSLTILPLKWLDHHPQLRLMTRQPTHQLSQLITHPASDQHNAQVPNSSKHAFHM